jgi:hypothetical protein
VNTDLPINSHAALQLIDRMCAQVYLGLRFGRIVPGDVVELACELLDWGHYGEAVREVVERDPARVSVQGMTELAKRILKETGFHPDFYLEPARMVVLRQPRQPPEGAENDEV